MCFPHLAQQLQRQLGHDDEAITVACGIAQMAVHALAIDVPEVERQCFTQPQAHAVSDEPIGFEAHLLGAADDSGGGHQNNCASILQCGCSTQRHTVVRCD